MTSYARKPILYHVGWGLDFQMQTAQATAADMGLEHRFLHASDGNYWKEQFELKRAAFMMIWNGYHMHTRLAVTFCQHRRIPYCLFEFGLAPQSDWFRVDPLGMGRDSILQGPLHWVTDADMEVLYALRKELRERHHPTPSGHVLVPCQIDNDTQMMFDSKYQGMGQFLAELATMYPEQRVLVRKHPKAKKWPDLMPPSFQKASEHETLWEALSKASAVVGISSTVLYEAVVYGVPVTAFGDHPLRTHVQQDHERVAAGALALRIKRGESAMPILSRFGLKPFYN